MATLDEIFKTDLAFTSDFVKTASGDIDTVAGVKNYKDALYRRLITTPGSLIHRPNYGVGIKLFRNVVNSIGERQRLARAIKEQFERDPRTKQVTGVSIKSDDDTPDRVIVRVSVEAVGYGELNFQFVA